MTEQQAHVIPEEKIQELYPQVHQLLTNLQTPTGKKKNLFEIVKQIDRTDPTFLSPLENGMLIAIRDGLCLHNYITSELLFSPWFQQLGATDPTAKAQAVNAVASYAAFASFSYMAAQIQGALADQAKQNPAVLSLEKLSASDFLVMSKPSQQAVYFLNFLLGLLTYKQEVNLIQDGRLNLDQLLEGSPVIADGYDLALNTRNFLERYTSEIAKRHEKERTGNPKYAEASSHIESLIFKYRDFLVQGFSFQHTAKVKVQEVEKIVPADIAGNDVAKQTIRRIVDRQALYNFSVKKSAAAELGDLLWSYLLDGQPGTGKTTLFKMLRYLALQRVEQINAAWAANRIGRDFPMVWNFNSIDSGQKSGIYGETQAKYRARLTEADDPSTLNTNFFEDVDLLLVSRNNINTSGADQDILKLVMDFLDGLDTIFRGNTVNLSSTNKATALDDAVRQRHKGRFDVSGPQTWKHFVQMLNRKMAKMDKHGLFTLPLGSYNPDDEVEGAPIYVVSHITQDVLRQLKRRTDNLTREDLGRMAERFHEMDPTFTGRAWDNVIKAVMTRSADYEVPEEWFTNPSVFFAQPYERQVEMLAKEHKPITGEMVVEEMDNYFQSENRYKQTAQTDAVKRQVLDTLAMMQAQGVLTAFLEHLKDAGKPITDVEPAEALDFMKQCGVKT